MLASNNADGDEAARRAALALPLARRISASSLSASSLIIYKGLVVGGASISQVDDGEREEVISPAHLHPP